MLLRGGFSGPAESSLPEKKFREETEDQPGQGLWLWKRGRGGCSDRGRGRDRRAVEAE